MPTSYKAFQRNLRQLLVAHFNRSEFNTLCFDLNVLYDDLVGETLTDKARELIGFMARQERLPELLDLLKEQRQTVDWPSIPEELPISRILDAADAKTSSSSIFHFSGPIQATNLNIGGVQENIGDIHVDMREINVQQPTSPVYMGDQVEMSGDFRGSAINVKSQLEHTHQNIQNAPFGDEVQKRSLLQLVEELEMALAKAPPEYAAAVAKVVRSLDSFSVELNDEKPDREMVRITGEGLKKAAENLKQIVPTVLTIATQIVTHALKFIS